MTSINFRVDVRLCKLRDIPVAAYTHYLAGKRAGSELGRSGKAGS